jgi:hypothetical protein
VIAQAIRRSGGAALVPAARLTLPDQAVPRRGEGDIRRQLVEVLARPEFNPKKDFTLWLVEKVRAVLEWLGGLRQNNPALYWIVLGTCLVLLTLLLLHLVWSLARVFGFDKRNVKIEPREERHRLSQTYADEAGRRAATGDFTEAVRCLFLALVYRFDEAGKVAFRKAYTNREYLALFADRRPVYEGLGVFVDTLDEHWYAERPTDAERYARCRALYERMA